MHAKEAGEEWGSAISVGLLFGEWWPILFFMALAKAERPEEMAAIVGSVPTVVRGTCNCGLEAEVLTVRAAATALDLRWPWPMVLGLSDEDEETVFGVVVVGGCAGGAIGLLILALLTRRTVRMAFAGGGEVIKLLPIPLPLALPPPLMVRTRFPRGEPKLGDCPPPMMVLPFEARFSFDELPASLELGVVLYNRCRNDSTNLLVFANSCLTLLSSRL